MNKEKVRIRATLMGELEVSRDCYPDDAGDPEIIAIETANLNEDPLMILDMLERFAVKIEIV
jgi:hypothetical protein